ncbi:MAG: transcription-repair coupling factor [Granulosicoccaceae bacterium]|jgi:transcription-repair coupling factor (superfamily II helicase)
MNSKDYVLQPALPAAGTHHNWGRLYGCADGLAIAEAAREHAGPVIVITPDTPTSQRLEAEIRFFLDDPACPILPFPDWETLPYDIFSPHQDIISRRLETLYRLPELGHGIVLLPVATLMQRLPPCEYVESGCLVFETGDRLDITSLRTRLEQAGYLCVPQVNDHGDFAVRGSVIDLYPMGSALPYRLDLFDDEIESIRSFDPESQRSLDKIEQVRLLPAREFPLDEAGIGRFRQRFRERFDIKPQDSVIYRDVSQGIASPGLEYFLPLFFDHVASLFDYLPDNSLLVTIDDTDNAAQEFHDEILQRHEQLKYDIERPLLDPDEVFLSNEHLGESIAAHTAIHLQRFELDVDETSINFPSKAPPSLTFNTRAGEPASELVRFIDRYPGRILFAAESAGRREVLLDILQRHRLRPGSVENWQAFLASDDKLGITVAPLELGLNLEDPAIAIIAEPQLFGEQAKQKRRRKSNRDTDNIIRNLTELSIGAPVVHEEHGVGRYLGLQTLDIGGIKGEFLMLEYANNDKLYVPVASLFLISRYTGVDPEHAPLHKLGSDQWSRARRKAVEKARDVAAELLDLYARRAARKGFSYGTPGDEYAGFAAAFPFEETADQHDAINDVLQDMASDQPMDRLVCGDVGFGKTEVAMRAAFMAVHAGKQVAILVPTTLLAQQHFENFSDRFADWPVRIAVLSRFRTGKQQTETIAEIAGGKIDIVIGTHKLLQEGIKFKNLGLTIIDEEHRFGVNQKERFKKLRTEVDVLTLTATPIPRTLNMALSQIRDMSVIATPPTSRLSIKTFVREWDDTLIHEACQREIRRGGQVYFVHNEVKTIEKIRAQHEQLVPEANIRVAHGQMRERELEQVMLDFYHQRFNLLLCTTIIETGIDVPSANTMVINRADRFGLAQLYQLRGRVGRSHHRAYAYLVRPERRAMTSDAVKRLEAIESLEDLGTGFMLATHDLEIRGAGELLGDEQSGQIQEVGFSLYTDLLERAVEALKSGKEPDLDKPLHYGAEINLHLPALIPEDYLPDVHTRLIMYKRISHAEDEERLRELQVEMIDRFGLLPEQVKTLFAVTRLKQIATPLGIDKIDIGNNGGRLLFGAEPHIDTGMLITLIQTQSQRYRFDGKRTLRINETVPEEKREAVVERLLDTLSNKDAA